MFKLRAFLISKAPYQTLSFFTAYLDSVEKILLHNDTKEKLKVYLIIALWIYFDLQNVYYFFAPLTDLEHFLVADIIDCIFGQRDFYLIFTSVNLVVIYFAHEYYLRGRLAVNSIFRHVVLRTNGTPASLHYALYQHFGPIAPTFRGKPVEIVVKQVALYFLNAMQAFKVVVASLLLQFQIVMALRAIHFYPLLKRLSLAELSLRVLQHTVNCLVIDLIWMSYCHLLILVASFGLLVVTYIYIRIRQNYALLKGNVLHFSWHSVDTFLRNDLHTFELFFKLVYYINNYFLVYMAFNSPTNAYLIMLLLQGRLNGLVALYVALFAIQQFVCLLGLHVMYANMADQLHCSSKLLLKLIVLNQHRMGDFRMKNRLALQLMRVHCTRKYGITYGPLTLVTITAFVKCSLFYAEMLMYSFTLIASH